MKMQVEQTIVRGQACPQDLILSARPFVTRDLCAGLCDWPLAGKRQRAVALG